jgi:putative sugar O-methyltransferase
VRRPIRGRSSIADTAAYSSFCREAAGNEATFATFRRAPVYNEILEHTSEELGATYLQLILERYAHLVGSFDAFRQNDNAGDPQTFTYGRHGAFSPTTLRYVKVLGDLERLFGDLSSMRIIEIGVGYGGQCRIIDAYRGLHSYCLVDLPPCLELAEAYLDRLGTTGAQFLGMDELDEASTFDLVVSNYAFSECKRPIQRTYLDKVLLRSSRGYLTVNTITPRRFRSFTQDELLDALPGSSIEAEEPKTHDGNYVVAWGGTDTLDSVQ